MSSPYNIQNLPGKLPYRNLIIELIEGPEFNNGKFSGKEKTVALLEGIQAEFRVAKYRCSVQPTASIRIANLTKEHIQLFTTFSREASARLRNNRIRLWAGFEEKNVSLIFDGDIIQALPTMPPDIWLDCECMSGYYKNFTLSSFSLNSDKTGYRDIAEMAAEIMDMSLEFKAQRLENTFKNFYFEGNLQSFLKKYNELGGAAAYIEGNTLVVDDLIPSGQQVPYEINKYSGLVGTVRPSPTGIGFTTVLMPDADLSRGFKIKSELIPAADGVYYPYSLVHRGNLRGEEWYTEFNAFNEDYGS